MTDRAVPRAPRLTGRAARRRRDARRVVPRRSDLRAARACSRAGSSACRSSSRSRASSSPRSCCASRPDRTASISVGSGPGGSSGCGRPRCSSSRSTVVLASTYWNGMQASDAIAGVFGYTNWHVIWSGQDELLRTIVGPLGPYWSLAIEEQFYVLLTVGLPRLHAYRSSDPLADDRRGRRDGSDRCSPSSSSAVRSTGSSSAPTPGAARSSPDAAWRSSCTSDPTSPTASARWLPAVGAVALAAIVVHRRHQRLRPAVAAPRRIRGPVVGQCGAGDGAADPESTHVGTGVATTGRHRRGELLDLPRPLAGDPDPHRGPRRRRRLGPRRDQGRGRRSRGGGRSTSRSNNRSGVPRWRTARWRSPGRRRRSP